MALGLFMDCLVDSTILVRVTGLPTADKTLALNATQKLRQQGYVLILAPQNLVEFWAVATRPHTANGLDLTPAKAEAERLNHEATFTLLRDPPGLYDRWVQLVNAYGVSGKQVHDTRLVAFMLEHGIRHILTFNVPDFARFSEIVAVHPSVV